MVVVAVDEVGVGGLDPGERVRAPRFHELEGGRPLCELADLLRGERLDCHEARAVLLGPGRHLAREATGLRADLHHPPSRDRGEHVEDQRAVLAQRVEEQRLVHSAERSVMCTLLLWCARR